MTVQHLLRRERGVIADRTGLLGQSPTAWSSPTSAGRVLEANPALCALTGYDAEEIVGAAPPLPSWPREDRAMLARKHGEAIAAGGGEFEARLVRKDGAEIHVLVRLAVRATAVVGGGADRHRDGQGRDRAVALTDAVSAERDHSRSALTASVRATRSVTSLTVAMTVGSDARSRADRAGADEHVDLDAVPAHEPRLELPAAGGDGLAVLAGEHRAVLARPRGQRRRGADDLLGVVAGERAERGVDLERRARGCR